MGANPYSEAPKSCESQLRKLSTVEAADLRPWFWKQHQKELSIKTLHYKYFKKQLLSKNVNTNVISDDSREFEN